MTEIVETRLLEDMAHSKPAAQRKERRISFDGGHGEFDLAGWIESHEIQIRRQGDWNKTGYRWVLEECPWNGHTDNAPFIVRWPDGTIGAGCHHNSCQGYGWRDLRQHYEPGCYDKQGSGSEVHGHRGGDSPGLEPNDGSAVSQITPFPTEVLPRTLKRFVREAATSIGCPPEFIAVPMLATLGAAIGNSVVLEAKGGYTESATLFTAVVGDPGSSKTPAFKVATAPAQKKQEELGREYREAVAAHERERREDFSTDSAQEPVYGRTVVQDTTVEALVERLAENPRGLLVSNDEISGWVRSMDQYKGGKGNDRQAYLSLWSNGSIIVDRKGRHGPLMISRPFAGIAGGIQPGVLSEIKNNRDDGLLDRFLFAYPDRVPYRWSEDEVSEETMAAYQRIYEELFGLGIETDENGVPDPIHATFMPSAKEAFVEVVHSLGAETEHPDFPCYLKGPWSKMRAYLLRLSLIIGIACTAEYTSRRPGEFSDFMKTEPVITERHVKAAVALVEYFKAHARRVYSKLHDHERERTVTAGGTRNAGTDKETDLVPYLEQFLKDRSGYWEGTTSELYDILKSGSVPGLPGGANHLGRQIRGIAADPNNGIVLAEGHSGKRHVIKLSLSTLGTVGNAEHTRTESTEGTESRNEGDKATAGYPDPDTSNGDPLAEIEEAIERLFDKHPEFVEDPDPEAIAVELFYWDYLNYIPSETEVQEVLDLCTACADQTH